MTIPSFDAKRILPKLLRALTLSGFTSKKPQTYLTLVMLLIVSLNSNSQNVDFDWAFPIGSSTQELSKASTTDNEGNILITGGIWGSVDFDPSTDETVLNSTDATFFLAKYGSDGSFHWVQDLGDHENGEVHSVDVDNSGNIYIQKLNDLFKFSEEGELIWQREIPPMSGSGGLLLSSQMVVSNDGNIYSVGSFMGEVNFDPNGTATLTSQGNEDIFLAKYNSDGEFQWVQGFGSEGSINRARCVSLNSESDVHVSGSFYNTLTLSSSTGEIQLEAIQASDIFVAQFDSLGALNWAHSMGGVGHDQGFAIKCDSQDNIILKGQFSESVDVDPSDGIYEFSTDLPDATFISKYNSTGNFQWANLIGSTSDSSFDFGSIAIDEDDNIFTSGTFLDAYEIGGFIEPDSDVNNVQNVYLLKYSFDGNGLWGFGLGGDSGNHMSTSMEVDHENNLVLFGRFTAPQMEVDPSNPDELIYLEGQYDLFLTKYKNCEFNLEICSCENIDIDCESDFNGDGKVDTADFLLLLCVLPCDSDCDYSLNNDAIVDTQDLLIFLCKYGSTCK